MQMTGPLQKQPIEGERLLRKLVAQRYDRCHPEDSFADLIRRATFSKEDRRLMEDWLDVGGRWRRS